MMLVLFIVLLALVAAVIAIIVVFRNRKVNRNRSLISFHENQEQLPVNYVIVSGKNLNTSGEKTVKFYACAPALRLNMVSHQAVDYTYEQIAEFIDHIYENKSDNFFVLENDQGAVLQFSNDGSSEVIEVDIPQPSQQGSYIGKFYNLYDVKSCVRAFFDNIDIAFNFSVRFEKY